MARLVLGIGIGGVRKFIASFRLDFYIWKLQPFGFLFSSNGKLREVVFS